MGSKYGVSGGTCWISSIGAEGVATAERTQRDVWIRIKHTLDRHANALVEVAQDLDYSMLASSPYKHAAVLYGEV